MTSEEVKQLIESARSIERERERIKQYIDEKREELVSVKSPLSGSVAVMSSEQLSVPERVYFRLEELYVQYSDVLQRLTDKLREIEKAISVLDPIEQEIVRAWIDGKTEEQIGSQIGYSRPTVSRYKRCILVKLMNIKKNFK